MCIPYRLWYANVCFSKATKAFISHGRSGCIKHLSFRHNTFSHIYSIVTVGVKHLLLRQYRLCHIYNVMTGSVNHLHLRHYRLLYLHLMHYKLTYLQWYDRQYKPLTFEMLQTNIFTVV